MTPRQMQELLPVLNGFAALRDLLSDKSFKPILDEFASQAKKNRDAEKAAHAATREREEATRKSEQAAVVAQEAEESASAKKEFADQRMAENDSSRVEFDEYRDAENVRLEEWEERLKAIPDTVDKTNRALTRAEKKLAEAEALKEQYEARLAELGLQEVA